MIKPGNSIYIVAKHQDKNFRIVGPKRVVEVLKKEGINYPETKREYTVEGGFTYKESSTDIELITSNPKEALDKLIEIMNLPVEFTVQFNNKKNEA
jgi:hypothetical protein